MSIAGLARALANVFLAPFWALGYVAGAVVVTFRLTVSAIRLGWREALSMVGEARNTNG